MTYGANAGNAADPSGCVGWRKQANDTIISTYGASVPVEWVGFQNTGFSVDTAVRHHNGVGGRLTTGVTANVNTELGAGIRLPHIWIYMIGTNDARSSKAAATLATDYTTSYNAVRGRLPSTSIPILVYTPEDPLESTFNALISQYNAQFPAVWSALTGSPLTTAAPPGLIAADMNAGDIPHPLAAGYTKIGDQIIPQLLLALSTFNL